MGSQEPSAAVPSGMILNRVQGCPVTPLIGQEEVFIRAPWNGTVVLRRLGSLTSNRGRKATLDMGCHLVS